MVKFQDYYSTLGVARDAAEKDIRRAYRTKARKHHPDVDKSAGAAERFREIAEAHEVLIDPKKRKLYDELGANWKEGQEFTPPGGARAGGGPGRRVRYEFHGDPSGFGGAEGFSSFFESLFGEAGRARGARSTGPTFADAEGELGGDDGIVQAILPISPHEAALGAKVPFTSHDGAQVTVTVPAGSSSGRKLRLRAMGRPKANGKRGDLIIDLTIVVPEKLSDEEKRAYDELARVSKFNPRAPR